LLGGGVVLVGGGVVVVGGGVVVVGGGGVGDGVDAVVGGGGGAVVTGAGAGVPTGARAGALTIKTRAALIERRVASMTVRRWRPAATSWKVSCRDPRRVSPPSSTYTNAVGPETLAPTSPTRTVTVGGVEAPRRGEKMRNRGTGAGAAGAAVVPDATWVAGATPVVDELPATPVPPQPASTDAANPQASTRLASLPRSAFIPRTPF
jgi:hypothetical protein